LSIRVGAVGLMARPSSSPWEVTIAFNADAGIVTVRQSKAGKPRHVVLTEEGQRLFASLTASKLGSEPIFTRADSGVWGKSHQLRPMP
jgi:hypothetical protein